MFLVVNDEIYVQNLNLYPQILILFNSFFFLTSLSISSKSSLVWCSLLAGVRTLHLASILFSIQTCRELKASLFLLGILAQRSFCLWELTLSKRWNYLTLRTYSWNSCKIGLLWFQSGFILRLIELFCSFSDSSCSLSFQTLDDSICSWLMTY